MDGLRGGGDFLLPLEKVIYGVVRDCIWMWIDGSFPAAQADEFGCARSVQEL